MIPFCLFGFLLLSSCTESDDSVEEFADWQNKNQTYWDNLYTATQQKIAAGDTSWKIIRKWSLEESVATANTDYIIAHVLTEGEGTVSPLYTDTVAIRYKGRLLPSASYAEGYEFDSTWKSATTADTSLPTLMTMTSSQRMTDGFATALQNMHRGDEWEVYIPWTLAYGTTDYSAIPAYSVLTFNLQLVSFHHVGSTVPAVTAKRSSVFSAR